MMTMGTERERMNVKLMSKVIAEKRRSLALKMK